MKKWFPILGFVFSWNFLIGKCRFANIKGAPWLLSWPMLLQSNKQLTHNVSQHCAYTAMTCKIATPPISPTVKNRTQEKRYSSLMACANLGEILALGNRGNARCIRKLPFLWGFFEFVKLWAEDVSHLLAFPEACPNEIQMFGLGSEQKGWGRWHSGLSMLAWCPPAQMHLAFCQPSKLSVTRLAPLQC